MPPAKQNANSKSIKDFFKPFTIPKSCIPLNDVVHEEIAVSPRKAASTSSTGSSQSSTLTPTHKRGQSRKDSPHSLSVPTPTKHSHNGSPRRSGVPQHDGAGDDLVHISHAGSQQRELEAVVIPISSLPPPPVPPSKPMADEPAVNTSFTSTTTLSNMALSSQSSSKRIVKNGMYAVTNSDSGSDDTDSSEELADISTFISPKRRKLSPAADNLAPRLNATSADKTTRRNARVSDEGTRTSTRSNTPKFPPSDKVYKHSLANMVKQQQKAEKQEARLQEAEAIFEATRRKRGEEERRSGGMEDGLQVAVADDSDEGERMKLAIVRTEALGEEERFYYFQGLREMSEERTTFPVVSDTLSFLNDKETRLKAYRSGLLAQLAAGGKLRESIYHWTLDNFLLETCEDLREAYVEVLCAYHTDPNVVDRCIRMDLDIFYDFAKLEPPSDGSAPRAKAAKGTLSGSPTEGLKHALNVVRNGVTSGAADTQSVAAVVSRLSFALLDSNVAGDTALRLHVQDTIQAILEHVDQRLALEEVGRHCLGALSKMTELSLNLRCQAIAAMPALSTSTHHFRRILALHVVTNKWPAQADYNANLLSPTWPDLILTILKSQPNYAISESTDYVLLTSLTALLDIAIDSGFSDHSFLSTRPSSTSTFIAAKPSPAETAFNAQIDAFTAQLQLMSSRIRDSGTSHLRRTEAKSAIDRLVMRLEYCVRTRPKPRKSVFGGGFGAGGREREFMSGFLRQGAD